MATEPEEDRPFFDGDEGGPVKSFLDHLEDFRWALVKSAAAVAIGVLVCLLAGNYLSEILMRPLHKAYAQYNGDKPVVAVFYGDQRLGTMRPDAEQAKALPLSTNQITVLEMAPITITNGTNPVTVMSLTVNTNAEAIERAAHLDLDLIVLSPAQAFLTGFHMALYGGLALASPFVFFFMGQFILPALRLTEKKYLYRGLAFAVPLFMTGVAFCYFILLPAALTASQVYSVWFGWPSPMWEASEYIAFVSKFMFGMGLGFELPVVILVLVKIGLLSYRTLVKARPYMIVINLVLGAILTTPEVFTQVLMAVPLQVLYEISVFIAKRWERAELKKQGIQPEKEPWSYAEWVLFLVCVAGAAWLGYYLYHRFGVH